MPPDKTAPPFGVFSRRLRKDKRVVWFAEPASVSNTPATWASAPRTAPCTCGMPAETVSVLHARIVIAMRLANFGVIEQLDQVRGNGNLSGMGTGQVNARIESGGRAHQGLKRHGAGQVGQL